MPRPLLLIDVDGVISLFGAGQTRPAEVVTALVDGIPHRLSRNAAAALRELAPTFECVWCTGWEERAGEHLPVLLDLPRGWPHISLTREFGVSRTRQQTAARPFAAHWKLNGIDAHAGPDRPLAWIDDAHDTSCREWAARRPGPTLLVETDPAVGLTADHTRRLRAWAAQLS